MPIIGDMSIIAIDDEYNIKDAKARESINTLETNVSNIAQYSFEYEQETETLKITTGKVGV